MAQLWGGRFTKETDQLVYNFNASISFDQKFLKQDIEGSIAHVVMLAKQGILTKEEKDAILKGLTGIREDVENGKLSITEEYEDIHSFVEANLIERIGDAGKKLHTGRSRAFKRTPSDPSCDYGRAYGDVHARIYASAKGPAGDAFAPYRRLF